MTDDRARLLRIREQAAILSGRKKRRGTSSGQARMLDERFNARVAMLCQTCRVPNPIEEAYLSINSLSFYVDGTWDIVSGTALNRTGRLFIEHTLKEFNFIRSDKHTFLYTFVPELKQAAATFFRDRWYDAEEKGRSFLTALKKAELIVVHWKH